ncbi:aminotransferase class V-fold PLP-dependent enzyme [Streptomyces sp. NPDC052687]|uniref:pyridoxal phosphate-dependent decarboxylase family protein n=1 Tax=Streptomyces sp. NPDC052687 TaxID=3154759 RepID=UPI0034227B24
MSMPPLASGPEGPGALGPLLDAVLAALEEGGRARGGPLPPGGPGAVTARMRDAVGDPLPDDGDPDAPRRLVRALAEGAADPADPLCAAHLHCPPLAVATAADLAASVLNPSLDSWDQAPSASALEDLVTGALAAEVYPDRAPAGLHPDRAATGLHPDRTPAAGLHSDRTPAAGVHPDRAPAAGLHPDHGPTAGLHPDRTAAAGLHPDHGPTAGLHPDRTAAAGLHPDHGPTAGLHPDRTPATTLHPDRGPAAESRPDCLITTGGTESNHLALLLAREAHGATVRLVLGANAHHSLARAAWLLGLPRPVVVPTPAGVLDPAALDDALTGLNGPLLVAATAGTTDAGLVDPLPEIAARCRAHGARLHVDAAYGGGLLFSDRRRDRLTGLDAADSVTLDLHKLGWQPVAAGLLAVRDARDLAALHQRADYLNAADDTEAGLPDLLGRSLRTTRRADALKIAVTLKTLGRKQLGALVDHVCDLAAAFAGLVAAHPAFELFDRPVLSTVLFRPAGAADDAVAAVRRTLLADGRAVLGRARPDGRLWLKATLLNPHTRPDDLAALLQLVEGHTPR